MDKIGIVEKILKYYQVIQAFMVVAITLVVFSFLNMPKKSVPKIIVNQGVIIGVYPGASSTEVEEKLTSKIEGVILSYEIVNKHKTHSHSKDGAMIIYVELKNSRDNSDYFWSKIESELVDLRLE